MGIWAYLKALVYGKPAVEPVRREEFEQESARTDVLLDRFEIAGVESCFRTGLINHEKEKKIRSLVQRIPSLVERVKDYLLNPEQTEYPLYSKSAINDTCWINLAHDTGLGELAGHYRIRSDIIRGTVLCFIVKNGVFDEEASRTQAKAFAEYAKKYEETTAKVMKNLCDNRQNLPDVDVCDLKPLLFIAVELGDEELVKYIKIKK